MSKKDFSVALKYVEARPRSQRRKGAEARVSGIPVGGSGISATDLSLLQANLISVTNNFTALKDLFDSMFEKDSEGNIHAKLSLWSSGGITAGGVGSGGSGGGGGISYNRLDSWSDYSADKAGYVLSALLGKDLDNRVSALANAGYVTQSALAPYALRSEIPSLTGYATQSWVLSQQYLTSISRSMVTDALGVTLEYVRGRISIPLIESSGVMEIGKYIDFHTLDEGDGVDYSLRIECQGAFRNRVYFPTTTGTLALTSNIPTKLSQLTDDVVAGKYLPLSGGTLSGSNRDLLNLDTLNTSGPRITLNENGNLIALIGCVPKQTTTDYGAYFVNVSSKFGVILGNDKKAYITLNTDTLSKDYQILHSGNYSNLLAGGTINGSLTATSFIGGTSTISGDLKGLQNLIFANGYLGRKFSLTNSGGIFYQAPSYSGGWATNWTVKSNDGITSFGDLAGAFGEGDSLRYFYFGGEHTAPSIAIMPSGMIAIGGKTADEKLHVHGNGKFTGALTANSLTIGGVTLTYDSVNEALCINGNMYALGGITAGGAGISAYTSLESRVARLEQQLNIS